MRAVNGSQRPRSSGTPDLRQGVAPLAHRGLDDPLLDPRRRRTVRWRDDHSHSALHASRERIRRTMGRHRPPRTLRSHPHLEAPTTRTNSSTSTSSITTRAGRTGRSANAHPTMRKWSSIGPADRSDDTPPAADSSTSTAKQPEPPQRPTRHGDVNFDAPTPPPHASKRNPDVRYRAPNEFLAPTGRRRCGCHGVSVANRSDR